MKINFTDKSFGETNNSRFVVRIDENASQEIKDKILQDYKNFNSKNMDEYLKINNEIHFLIHKKKELLSYIKHDFEVFSTDRYPEYNL